VTWFKVDDKLHDHRKVRMLGTSTERLAALGLWTVCGSWAADHTTDGYVPVTVARRDDPKGRYARRLVAVGMWSEVVKDGEAGYQFHDWEIYQPTSTELEQRRRLRAEAGRLGGLKTAEAKRRRQASAQASAEASA
jgi:hypothetical protein